jgi:hypothetical protein
MTIKILKRKHYDMIRRCHNEKAPNYKYYGGRGISVCDRWRDSFENFLIDMGVPDSFNLEVDRIDNNGNYCPENCRWSTHKENTRNTRHCFKLAVYKNDKFVKVFNCTSEAAENLKIQRDNISHFFCGSGRKRYSVGGYYFIREIPYGR